MEKINTGVPRSTTVTGMRRARSMTMLPVISHVE